MQQAELKLVTKYQEMKAKGCTRREIAENLGITPEQVHGFVKRHNKNLRNKEAGVLPKKKGRPSKVKSLEDKLADLRYKLARKDARIKQLEMENELMRDFLSLTERK